MGNWENRSVSFSPEELKNVASVRDLAHVNKIKVSALKKIIAETDFKIVRYKTYASKYLYPFKYIPGMNDYFINMVVVVLQK